MCRGLSNNRQLVKTFQCIAGHYKMAQLKEYIAWIFKLSPNLMQPRLPYSSFVYGQFPKRILCITIDNDKNIKEDYKDLFFIICMRFSSVL